MTLSRRGKLLYGAGGLGAEALTQSRNVWLIFFYAPPADADRPVLLKLATVSVLLFLVRLVEAFDDPLVGPLSDRTRSLRGRRLPFIVGATPFWALFAFLLFVPPENASQPAIAIYFFVVLWLFHLFATLNSGPYESLLPELARSSQERVTLSGLRVYFGIAGAAIGLIGSGLLVDQYGFGVIAAVIALLALGTRILGVFGIWNQVGRDQPPATLPFRSSLRAMLANHSFRVFLPTFILFQLGLLLLTGMLPFYVRAILETDQEGRWVALLTAIAIGSMAAALPGFMWLARRRSKRDAYRAAMLASALAFPLLCLPDLLPGIPVTIQVVAALVVVGAPIAGVYLFPSPLIADICDDDARQTGMRREALFFGTQAFVEKTAGSLGPVILGGLLLLGATAEDPLGIRLIGPVAGLLVFAGFLMFRNYRLPDQIESSEVAG